MKPELRGVKINRVVKCVIFQLHENHKMVENGLIIVTPTISEIEVHFKDGLDLVPLKVMH